MGVVAEEEDHVDDDMDSQDLDDNFLLPDNEEQMHHPPLAPSHSWSIRQPWDHAHRVN